MREKELEEALARFMKNASREDIEKLKRMYGELLSNQGSRQYPKAER